MLEEIFHLVVGFLTVPQLVHKIRLLCPAAVAICDNIIGVNLCLSLQLAPSYSKKEIQLYSDVISGCKINAKKLSLPEIQDLLSTASGGPNTVYDDYDVYDKELLFSMRKRESRNRKLHIYSFCQTILGNLKSCNEISGAHHERNCYWRTIKCKNSLQFKKGKRLSPFSAVKFNQSVWWFEASTKFIFTHSGRWGIFLRVSGMPAIDNDNTDTWICWLCKDAPAALERCELALATDPPREDWPPKLLALEPSKGNRWIVSSVGRIGNPGNCLIHSQAQPHLLDLCIGVIDITETGEVISRVKCDAVSMKTTIMDIPETGLHFEELRDEPPPLGMPLESSVAVRAILSSGEGHRSGMEIDFFYLWPMV